MYNTELTIDILHLFSFSILLHGVIQKIWTKSRTTFFVLVGVEIEVAILSIFGVIPSMYSAILLVMLLYSRAVLTTHDEVKYDKFYKKVC